MNIQNTVNTPAFDTLPEATQKIITRAANTIARDHGAHSATTIIIGSANRIVSHTPCGHRKKSNDQYVPTAYWRKAWSSCYYQHAEAVVEVDARALLLCA